MVYQKYQGWWLTLQLDQSNVGMGGSISFQLFCLNTDFNKNQHMLFQWLLKQHIKSELQKVRICEIKEFDFRMLASLYVANYSSIQIFIPSAFFFQYNIIGYCSFYRINVSLYWLAIHISKYFSFQLIFLNNDWKISENMSFRDLCFPMWRMIDQ